MPIASIRHLTVYRYRKPVVFGEHGMMMRPLENDDQRLICGGYGRRLRARRLAQPGPRGALRLRLPVFIVAKGCQDGRGSYRRQVQDGLGTSVEVDVSVEAEAGAQPAPLLRVAQG